MKLSTRSAVGLAVCAALAGTSAQALTRTEYAALPAAQKIYFGGATATDNVLEAAFIALNDLGICDTTLGNIDIYRAANERVITCKVSDTTTPGHGFATRAAGGTSIAFHKESRGGSSNGVTPLLNVSAGQAHSLLWLDVSQLANDCTVVNKAATATAAAYIEHSDCATVYTPADTAGSAVYDIHGGISDVEPSLSYPAPSTTEVARLTVNPGVAIVFGVPVSLNLYRALQHVQFAGACDAALVNDTTACVPSFTREQVRGLFSGNSINWNKFKDVDGNNLNTAAALDGVVSVPASGRVKNCRRVATSGTQASFETYFLHQRCVTGAPSFVSPDIGTITDTTWVSTNGGALVTAHTNAAPSSGNVRSCLNDANSQNVWAIGVLSTEITDSQVGNFRFVGLDGAAPNLTNVANGTYDFFTENTLNRIADGNTGALTNGDIRREVVELVDERLGNTAGLAAMNADFDGRPWGNGGVLALSSVTATATAPYSDAEMSAEPVNTQGRGGNNCTPPVQKKIQPVFGVE